MVRLIEVAVRESLAGKLQGRGVGILGCPCFQDLMDATIPRIVPGSVVPIRHRVMDRIGK